MVLLFFTLSSLGKFNFLAAFHEICRNFTEFLENVWLCLLCIFEPKKKLWWFWIPWDQNVPLKFYNAFYIWHHFICIWVHTRIVHPPWTVRSLYKNSRPLWLQTLYFFRLFLDKQKITDVVRLNKKIELNFMSWRIKNRRKKQNYHIQRKENLSKSTTNVLIVRFFAFQS